MAARGRLTWLLGTVLLAGLVSASPRAVQTPTGTGAISGVVSDSVSRRPILGAVVTLSIQGPGAGPVGRQTTDARGRFVFDELPPSAQYVVAVVKSGYLAARYGDVPGVMAAQRITLADGQWFSTADIQLPKVGAIGGVVTDEVGEPVVGAFVRALLEVTIGGRRRHSVGFPTKTDDHGEYRLTGLLPGRYIVMLPSVQNTVPISQTSAEIEGLPADIYAQLQERLAQGRATRHLNNGAIASGSSRLIIGNFVTPPAPANGRDRAYPLTFYPGVSSLATAASVDMTDGVEKSGINISLQPVPAVRVSGRIEGMTTTSRVLLRLMPAGLEGFGSGGEGATTMVEKDGSFTFLNVPAGAYTVDTGQTLFEIGFRNPASAVASIPESPGRQLLDGRMQTQGSIPGAAPGTMYTTQYDKPQPSYFGRTPVSVGGTDVTGVVVSVRPSVTVHGRFVYEDMPNGPPVRPMTVLAEASGGTDASIAPSNFDSPPDAGAFTIAHLASGAYLLHPTPPAGAVLKSITSGGQDYSKKPIDLTAGRDVDDVVITFTGKGATLSGTVREAPGRTLDRPAIIAFTTDRTAWPDLGLVPAWARLTAASSDGTFRMLPLPAGEYFVVAIDQSRAGSWTDPVFLEQAAAVATRVSLDWSGLKSVDLVVWRGGPVR